MTKYNLKDVSLPLASFNFPDMYTIKDILEALKKKNDENHN